MPFINHHHPTSVAAGTRVHANRWHRARSPPQPSRPIRRRRINPPFQAIQT